MQLYEEILMIQQNFWETLFNSLLLRNHYTAYILHSIWKYGNIFFYSMQQKRKEKKSTLA